ncbi:hypothetical protein BLA3211_03157 [Burkholderia aenigmatica]|uniref:Uncharacterized protein n=1 Tax=Burkholderia aenigmatica TaxID=2015348 RepID=A0A6J5J055_9BURK|nr:hypothetical protein BLA3211_03157 [Burkholderia aenigmatica]
MGGNPYDPLTTTNSSKESAMANAYSKTRPKKLKRYPEVELILGDKPDLPQKGQPYMLFRPEHNRERALLRAPCPC